MSHILSQPARGYTALPDFPAVATDPSVREIKIEVAQAPVVNKAAAAAKAKAAKKSDPDHFYSDSESDASSQHSTSSYSRYFCFHVQFGLDVIFQHEFNCLLCSGLVLVHGRALVAAAVLVVVAVSVEVVRHRVLVPPRRLHVLAVRRQRHLAHAARRRANLPSRPPLLPLPLPRRKTSMILCLMPTMKTITISKSV
jgi:hypothetical protein